jgi:hypothetical protein
MKKLKNILNEGVLDNIDDTLRIGDKNAKIVELLPFFENSYNPNKFPNGAIVIRGLEKIKRKTPVINDFIDTACEYDGSVLTIDLDKFKFGADLTVIIVPGPKLPLIKVLDSSTKRVDVVNKGSDRVEIKPSVMIIGNKKWELIDLSKVLHPGTKVSMASIGDCRPFGYEKNYNTLVKTNEVPGTIGITYYVACNFQNLIKNGWPKGIVRLSPEVIEDAAMAALGFDSYGKIAETMYSSREWPIK